ncbi:MedA [Metarhizium album ARSEF 1941]|uniref:MedA n=1 Tax=Metarhizium album (strain ARSEF 1941) TaxID=1081103 RepID=A0A0B2WPZ0_METAS|nr:MedA [Metarhizium album ARSEF 1941]KHN95060.1 MedA [Metarhizium album ARSEF 1941]
MVALSPDSHEIALDLAGLSTRAGIAWRPCDGGNANSSYSQSGVNADRTIIVGEDNGLDSPDTLVLKHEEAVRAADGRGPRRDSLTNLDMATYSKAQLPSVPGYDTARYQDSTYDQYPAQNFAVQQTEKYAHLNQQSFASNNGVAQYIHTGPTVLSCQPMSGMFGTKIFMKISSQYDLVSLSAMPYFSVSFGSEKVPVQDFTRDAQDTTGFVYSCSVDAPQPLVTGCNGNNVPLSLIAEGPTGEEISRTGAGSFQYLEGSEDDMTRTSKHGKHDIAAPGPRVDQASASPKTVDTQLPPDTATHGYDYPSQQSQYANAFSQGNGDMITTYRSSSSFTEPHYRRSAPWSGFGGPLGSARSSLDHSAMSGARPSLTPLPMPSSAGNGTPQLIRTSTIANGAGGTGSYHPISLYSSKASLKIIGKLDSMADNWCQEEWENRRRIVMFRKSQTGCTLTATFRAVPVNERPPNSICVSCIWWQEKQKCYVTSVDTIHLLEQLVASPNRFSVEEKNRIRRNLEGFHPLTVSKSKPDSEDFFKIIMGFPNPKPRNIEKDVKVFPWEILDSALRKIIGKYSATPSSMVTPVNPTPYAPLPTPPGHGIASQQSLPSQHGDGHSQYSVHSNHHDPIPSPRSLSGSQSTWTPYTTGPTYGASSRALSPANRHASPQQGHQHAPPMRINTNPLPAVTTYDSRTVSSTGYSSSGLHTPISQHPSSTATPPRWDNTSAGYSDSYSSLTSHQQPGPSVYSAGAYGDGATRV